jgi:hypothetical protein
VFISEIQFWEVHGATALCVLVTENGIISLQCNSRLSAEAPDAEHRAAWLKDALRQQNRMPEFRDSKDIIEICPNALSFIGVTPM